MRKQIRTLAIASTVAAGLAAASALYAHESQGSGSSTMGSGMMGEGGMMGMMGQMSEMMKGCSGMMRSMNQGGSGTPNEQWRKDAPEADKRPDANR